MVERPRPEIDILQFRFFSVSQENVSLAALWHRHVCKEDLSDKSDNFSTGLDTRSPVSLPSFNAEFRCDTALYPGCRSCVQGDGLHLTHVCISFSLFTGRAWFT